MSTVTNSAVGEQIMSEWRMQQRDAANADKPCECRDCTLQAVAVAVHAHECAHSRWAACLPHRDAANQINDDTGSWYCNECNADIGRIMRWVPV